MPSSVYNKNEEILTRKFDKASQFILHEFYKNNYKKVNGSYVKNDSDI